MNEKLKHLLEKKMEEFNSKNQSEYAEKIKALLKLENKQ